MKSRIEILEQPLTIAGPSATIEKASAAAQIGALWGAAGQSRALAGEGPTFGVYDRYEDRLANRYRVTVGQATSVEHTNRDAAAVEVPAGTYVVFEARGPVAQVAQRLWHHVWTAWPDRDRRTFAVDFERYEVVADPPSRSAGSDTSAPEEAHVALYIGVTPQ